MEEYGVLSCENLGVCHADDSTHREVSGTILISNRQEYRGDVRNMWRFSQGYCQDKNVKVCRAWYYGILIKLPDVAGRRDFFFSKMDPSSLYQLFPHKKRKRGETPIPRSEDLVLKNFLLLFAIPTPYQRLIKV